MRFEFKYICLIMVPVNLLIIVIFSWMECFKAGYLKNNEIQTEEKMKFGELDIGGGQESSGENELLLSS